jgi:hypothetical protein
MKLWHGRSGRGGTVRWRAGTVLALLALFSQLFVALLPMPVMAGDGTPICAPDQSGRPVAPKPDGQHHLPDCPVCQAAQLLGSLNPPDPAGMPAVFQRVERAALPVVAGLQPRRVFTHRQARAPPVEI